MTYRTPFFILIIIGMALALNIAFAEPSAAVTQIRIGLVSGVGLKAEVPIGSDTELQLMRTTLPNEVLAKLPAGGYVAKAASVSMWVSAKTYASWDLLPDVFKSNGIPYITASGLRVVFSADPQNLTLPNLQTDSIQFEAVEAVGLYNLDKMMALLDKKVGSAYSLNMPIKVGNFRYRGAIAFEINKGILTPVNHLPIEAYLYGVIPKEVSPSWPTEAIKAQAVAARTYAYSGLGRFNAKGYDLTDDTLSQMYRGFGVEDPRSNLAVDQTAGQCAYYQGKRIDALFHSNSGGYTEDSELVFVNALPYLRGKEDPYSLGAPNDLWVVSYTPTDVENLLKKSGRSVGAVQSIVSRSVSQYGRVLKLEITGLDKTVTLEKEQMRSVFGTTVLKSLLFNVSKGDKMSVLSSSGSQAIAGGNVAVISANGVSTLDKATVLGGGTIDFLSKSVTPNESFRFIGRGYGHGVGLSQFGAKKMAELGKSYIEILTFYYTGITVASN